jgi:restriction system protein
MGTQPLITPPPEAPPATSKMTKFRNGFLLQTVLREIKRLGGEARLREVLQLVETKLELSDFEKAVYEKSGLTRWVTQIHFYSVDCARAGFIVKDNGRWLLTPEGESALALPPGDFFSLATKRYRQWKAQKDAPHGQAPPVNTEDDEEAQEPEPEVVRVSIFEQAQEQARTEIEDHIDRLSWVEFQDLVAELLRAMGYHISSVAPPGRDGGIDIVAYRDPLGVTVPRLKVQVKHREQKSSVKDVRELEALLRKDGDIGLIVASGGFTSEVVREIRSSSKHIETMNLGRVIDLWQEHYDHVSQAGRALLPLARLHFLAPADS